MRAYASWGNYPEARHDVQRLHWSPHSLSLPTDGSSVLPRGLGRSYGDSCLNDGGTLLDTTPLDRLLEFDTSSGRLRAEAGVSLETVLRVAVPRGWFLPVTPGTKFVTLAGAVANDIHGKNHHRAGTFGRFVESFELLRSDGSRIVCSRDRNAELFAATIGGLGLTGLITWVEVRLKSIQGPSIDMESIRFDGLDEFFDIAEDSDSRFEYTVAWVDCLAGGSSLGRGHFLRGNHAPGTEPRRHRSLGIGVPFDAPELLLNRWTIRTFNAAYFHRQRQTSVRRSCHYEPFFYPLDGVNGWNRLYGKRGFLQYQCVIPTEAGREPVRELFERIAGSRESSFLSVLKIFGPEKSPGLLSFPRPGVTLALDFPIRGRSTFDLLDALDALVRLHAGRVYPAKDARMTPDSFRAFFPEWRRLVPHVDPRFSSSFWRRVHGEEPGA